VEQDYLLICSDVVAVGRAISLIGCLHDPANFQQSFSKRPANIQMA